MDSFLSLLADHEQSDDMFLQHQEALMTLDLASARALLLIYERRLVAHMEAEESLLLPVYERAGRIPGGPPVFFTGEHRRMREFIARFHSRLDEMDAGHPERRKVIELFDHQATYKHLVEHHDQRERNILYPTLDRVTSVGERTELLQRFNQDVRRTVQLLTTG